MDKIEEIINNLKAISEKELDLKSLLSLKENLTSIDASLGEVIGKSIDLEKQSIEKQRNVSNFKVDLEDLGQDINDKISPTIELLNSIYERLESFKSPKSALLSQIKELFKDIEKNINFDKKKMDKEILQDFEVKLEVNLVDRIEKVFFDYQGDVEQLLPLFDKFNAILKNVLNQVAELKERPYDQFNFLELNKTLNETLFPQVSAIFNKIKANSEELSSEIKSSVSQVINPPISSLQDVNKSLADLDQESIEGLKDKDKQISDLKDEIEKLKKEFEDTKSQLIEKETELQGAQIDKLNFEIKELRSFLESNPRYQLLYIINNLEKTNLEKVNELFKGDPMLTRVLLKNLSDKELISLSGDEDLSIEIKKKLNPISSIVLENVYENELVKNFRNYSDSSSFEKYFNEIMGLIDNFKQKNKEEAGYLISLLYLYIYESKNYHYLDKIRAPYLELKEKSFYIRLIEYALYSHLEVEQFMVSEGLIEAPKFLIFNEENKLLKEGEEDFPKNQPFTIEKYKIVSILNASDEIIVEKSPLNNFSSLSDLVKWVWYDSQGAKFEIQFKEANDNSMKITASKSKAIDADLIINNYEMTAG